MRETEDLLGKHFWARGYCVDTIGFDEEKIIKDVKHQVDNERKEDQQSLKFSSYLKVDSLFSKWNSH